MITNSSPSPSSSTPVWLWAWLWEWGGDTLRVLVMTGSSAGPDTCASARTACTWAGWAATQAASSSSFATRKWAGQPHRPCMRRTRWTFAGEGIGRGRGGGGGVARKVEMKNETQRDLALSHLPNTRPVPVPGQRSSPLTN